jgi:hypothetical protein
VRTLKDIDAPHELFLRYHSRLRDRQPMMDCRLCSEANPAPLKWRRGSVLSGGRRAEMSGHARIWRICWTIRSLCETVLVIMTYEHRLVRPEPRAAVITVAGN